MSLKNRIQVQYQTDREAGYLTELPPIPRNMMLELSNACNHSCAFCPSAHMRRKRGLMSDTVAERVISEAAAAGVREIGFYSTGEPFVHKGLARLVAHAKKVGITYTYISTNGALATPERAAKVLEAGLDSIKFSVNAGSRETYKAIHGADDFETVKRNIQFIADYRREHKAPLKLFATCVVTKLVEHEVPAIRDWLSPLVDEVQFNPCAPFNWPEQALSGQAEICHLPFNRLHVTCEGYLTLCCVDYQNYLAVADLNQMSLTEAWHSEAYAKARRMHLEDKMAGTLCGRCWRNAPDPVEPLIPALADVIDYEEYDQSQRQTILESLRTNFVETGE
ncbi:radical SAM/SPASM domain-containing protein [Magnetospirillum aberrantis]|uniref:Radical SAM protein n=1 Tax=Magnetospirillum aberrantis SpK TaxID=908842 RepID=A0A7C9QRF0_9PROT|nr:radical SAM/SPASM domain-containing protein [Magnetospirillum aberrantis]NFV78564.1 radical SAM protein [Magnetospirillum aberrantis SpK]